jgi:6-phosphogluconate dehydrogenase
MAHDIGVYGMAVMGQNLALNIAQRLKESGSGSVAVSNRSASKVRSGQRARRQRFDVLLDAGSGLAVEERR